MECPMIVKEALSASLFGRAGRRAAINIFKALPTKTKPANILLGRKSLLQANRFGSAKLLKKHPYIKSHGLGKKLIAARNTPSRVGLKNFKMPLSPTRLPG